jgi:hypothetical protein
MAEYEHVLLEREKDTVTITTTALPPAGVAEAASVGNSALGLYPRASVS